MIETGGVFTDKKFAEKCWTHDFMELVDLAGLIDDLNDARKASAAVPTGLPGGAFVGFWKTAVLWKETIRYEDKTQREAEDLYEALTTDPEGVLKWIQKYW